jgi:hypothetical protein
MQIQPNQFFNPSDCPFEVRGFFEEYIAEAVGTNWPKVLGWKILDANEAPRPLGSLGIEKRILTAPITLKKGHKEITIKASSQRPITVTTMVQVLCGPTKERQ